MIPPTRLASPRLVLRCWEPDMASQLRLALEAAWDDLQRWIPWVFPELEDVPALTRRLEGYRDDFRGGGNALYAVMRLLTDAGLSLDGIHRLEIRCDPRHSASVAVPRKLGYRHRETLVADDCAPDAEVNGADQAIMIWELTAPARDPRATTRAG